MTFQPTHVRRHSSLVAQFGIQLFPISSAELGIGVNHSDGTRIHFPTCEPCLGHGFQNYLGPGVGAQGLNCGRDGAVAVLKPVSKAKVIKSLSVAINGVLQANLPTYENFRTFEVRLYYSCLRMGLQTNCFHKGDEPHTNLQSSRQRFEVQLRVRLILKLRSIGL